MDFRRWILESRALLDRTLLMKLATYGHSLRIPLSRTNTLPVEHAKSARELVNSSKAGSKTSSRKATLLIVIWEPTTLQLMLSGTFHGTIFQRWLSLFRIFPHQQEGLQWRTTHIETCNCSIHQFWTKPLVTLDLDLIWSLEANCTCL